MCSCRTILIFLIFMGSGAVSIAQTNNEVFFKLVGPESAMNPEITAQVLRGEPGEKFYDDSDHDGRIDVIYLIDSDERHGDERKPLLVKIVDEDGDMHNTGEGDLDSDLYVADWYGDGTIDRVIDYIDLDHDNDVDEQILYQWSDLQHFVKRAPKTYNGRAYCAAWAKDYGDDNRLWYDSNYEYSQRLTQWLTDFNGDEMFVYLFFYDYEQHTLSPAFENAFAFYDRDGDRYSEEVVRFVGFGPYADNVRYSMDIDNDTRGSTEHDYDFSISSLGPVDLPLEKCVHLNLRGCKTGPIIKWEHTRQVAKAGKWGKTHLTWDENDSNVDPRPGRQHNERWEGIINHGNQYMSQVGGPSCGLYNKRNEVDMDASGTFAFYYSTIDRKLHLFGAEVGWIDVDYDYDDKIDMIVHMNDTDKDGFFDTWKYDVDADSTFDREFRTEEDRGIMYPFEYNTLHDAYIPELERAVRDNQNLIDVLKTVLQEHEAEFSIDAIEDYFHSEIMNYGGDFQLGEKIKNSPEGTRYYGDIIRERYWHRFGKTSAVNDRRYPEIKQAYETGKFLEAASLLEEHILKKKVTKWYGQYTKRFTIELSNPDDRYLEYHPLVLKINEIRNVIPDFNPDNYVITGFEPRIDWRLIPSQADDTDSDGRPDELVCVHSLMPCSTTRLSCYYSPDGSHHIDYPAKTDTNRDWTERHDIGWESNVCAYRMYDGQIDFFGKRRKGLCLKTIGEIDYHRISDWGMDVLHVGESSGLGSITIWEGGTPIPVMNPAGKGTVKIEQNILARGPVRSLVRIDFTNLHSENSEYTVTLMMSAFAENRFSRQDITITSTVGDSVVYSPGVVKIPNDMLYIDTNTGVLASWGLQDRNIMDIGMGVMFVPGEYTGYTESALDRYIKLKIPADTRCTHWIVGGWRKGFTSPVAPSGKDWAEQVEALGLGLRTPVSVRYYSE